MGDFVLCAFLDDTQLASCSDNAKKSRNVPTPGACPKGSSIIFNEKTIVVRPHKRGGQFESYKTSDYYDPPEVQKGNMLTFGDTDSDIEICRVKSEVSIYKMNPDLSMARHKCCNKMDYIFLEGDENNVKDINSKYLSLVCQCGANDDEENIEKIKCETLSQLEQRYEDEKQRTAWCTANQLPPWLSEMASSDVGEEEKAIDEELELFKQCYEDKTFCELPKRKKYCLNPCWPCGCSTVRECKAIENGKSGHQRRTCRMLSNMCSRGLKRGNE